MPDRFPISRSLSAASTAPRACPGAPGADTASGAGAP
eukprot:gene4819-4976_t